MKYNILLLFLFLVVSCGSTEKNESVNSTTTIKEKPSETKPTENLDPLGDPCQIPASEIATIVGWEDYFDGQPNAINSKTLKVCDYSSKLAGSLSISFKRHKITNPEGKYLERSFDRELKNTSEKITYQEVADGLGDQAVYHFGKKGPNYIYNMRWRFGNHTENTVYLRSTQERDSEETLAQLKIIAGKLK